ncbi:MAG TPA: choice-of-anchor D domain-containing protein [bacterium]|nr:choice-of-anchor D domain-containing protein [bacterium]
MAIFLGGISAMPTWATVAFANIFTNNMILQRTSASFPVGARIYGTDTNPGEPVTVNFNGQAVTGLGDNNGNWAVTLAPMSANTTGQGLTVTGPSNSVGVTNVVVGDIYLCSGQSNMDDVLLSQCIPNGASDATTADFPNIRLLHIQDAIQQYPLSDIPANSWSTCVPASGIGGFSGLAFYIGRDLFLAEGSGVPIGLIQSAYGGMPAEAFMSKEAILSDPAMAAAAVSLNNYGGTLADSWPSGTYNAMIAPLTGFNLRGVFWDQGETNESNSVSPGNPHGWLTSEQYDILLPSLIKDWRMKWGAVLPFYVVQLQNIANMNASSTPCTYWGGTEPYTPAAQVGIADVRWGQFMALYMPNTGMSVNFDLNPAPTTCVASVSYHPLNKEAFAARIAPWALNQIYGNSVPYTFTGPLYQSAGQGPSAVTVLFSSPGGGTPTLGTRDGQPVTGFQVAQMGADPNSSSWSFAAATLSGNKVVVNNPFAPNGALVRYAWGWDPVDPNGPVANLSDSVSYLASPFQTYGYSNMEVAGNSSAITDLNFSPTSGNGTDFGSVVLCGAVTQTFTIDNNSGAGATLNLTGGPDYVRVTGPDASDFTVVSQPTGSPLDPGMSETFQVSFHPSGSGLRQAILQIPNDTPYKTPYTIYIQGTGGATCTPTPTPTGTWYSPTPTSSPTNTVTPTPTPSPTPAAADNTVYNFEDGTVMGWTYVNNQAINTSNSTSMFYLGSHSLAVSIKVTSTSTDAEFGAQPVTSVAANLTGKTLIGHLWVPSNFPASSSALFFLKSGSGFAWQTGPSTSLTPGAWNTLTLNPAQPYNLSGTPDITNVQALGVQLFASSNWAGTINLDSVDVLAASTATPTPTTSPTPTGTWYTATPTPTFTPAGTDTTTYNFEDGGVDGWTYYYNAVISAPVNSIMEFYLGSHSLQAPVSYTGSNTDIEVGIPYSGYNMAGDTITAHVWVPANFPTSSPADIFLKCTSSYNWSSSTQVMLSPGAWTTLTYNLAGVPNTSSVYQMGIQIQPSAPWAGNIYLDSVDLTASGVSTPTNTPSATPTISPTATPPPPASSQLALGPNVVREGQLLCLYLDKPASDIHWTFYNVAGERLKDLDFGSDSNPCWVVNGLASGYYLVRVVNGYPDQTQVVKKFSVVILR